MPDDKPLCFHPTLSYKPDYKAFKFNEKNGDMKGAKDDKGTSTSENLVVSDVKNQGCGYAAIRNSLRATEDWEDEKDLHRRQTDALTDSERTVRKEYHTRNRDMEYELPELVVFLQESCYHFVKEICFDKEMPSQPKCFVENCELDHNTISCLLNSDAECKTEPAVNILQPSSPISNGYKPEGEVDVDAKDDISVDHFTKQIVPESLLLVRKVQKAVLADTMVPSTTEETEEDIKTRKASISSTEELPPHNPDCQVVAPETDQDGIFQQCFGESSFHGACPFSGPISFSGPILSSRSISHRSNSTTSSRSFAFPILASEWNGSPVRMVKADRPPLRKQRGWRICFLCCKF
ncbi:hypothetical protein FNV43_RR20768 [Rhamnella rubrinervis]|uniref:Uncharacterized protein n=1 Tax=Rhamnella rubrinervis TaxID=2594499 RepID=A0A8K0GQS5_9ROSA|nr:hypothetical protein FNV43_RR20768 [Rhamnella rubrinervis]